MYVVDQYSKLLFVAKYGNFGMFHTMLGYNTVRYKFMPLHSGNRDEIHLAHPEACAGIFKQSVGARKPSRNRVVVPARQATQPGRIGSLESILGLL
jgi:hypothetical protein